MGKLKLFLKSVVFSTRSRRRFFTFVLVFSILSGATVILLSYFDNFSREGLLEHRGVVVKVSGFPTTPVTLQTVQGKIDPSIAGAEAVIYYKYINFGTNLRIFSISPKYSWGFTELKPNTLTSGRFPTSTYEVLVSENALLPLEDSQGLFNIYTKPVTGTRFKLGIGVDSTFDLTVSGIFKKPVPSDVESDTLEWILLTEEAFNTLTDTDHLSLSSSEIFVHSVTIIASGDVFSGDAYNNVDDLAAGLKDLESDVNYNTVEFTSKTDKDEDRSMMFLSLLFGLFGTFMVSTLYSYLITRFRRREVAVLKAMGYSKMDVRIVVLCEILVVAVTGFLIGIFAIQLYLWNPLARQSSYVYLIILSPTALLSFLAVVISCVPGFILITTRILSVRPIEIFRQK